MTKVSKPLEFAKDINTIELACEAEVADTFRKVREAVELSKLDPLGRRLTQKNK